MQLEPAGPILNQADLDELKAIYKAEYGEEISDEEAIEMGNRLIRVFAVLTRVPKNTPLAVPEQARSSTQQQ